MKLERLLIETAQVETIRKKTVNEKPDFIDELLSEVER